MHNLAQVQNGRLAPPITQDAHADRAKRLEVEKLIIVYNVDFLSAIHCILLCLQDSKLSI